uniref:Hypothetical secreted peptide 1675 n=1 Tax=Amblyomma variegatum TaxID=34610 RepID=F0J9X7_AMBVA|nr:TPA_inf: hypothetical secreted peptide precursor 1675 [Amblyomma variegatum]
MACALPGLWWSAFPPTATTTAASGPERRRLWRTIASTVLREVVCSHRLCCVRTRSCTVPRDTIGT